MFRLIPVGEKVFDNLIRRQGQGLALLSSWQKRIILSVNCGSSFLSFHTVRTDGAYLTVCELILEVLPYGQLPLLQHW